jgi:hypothetical protein
MVDAAGKRVVAGVAKVALVIKLGYVLRSITAADGEPGYGLKALSPLQADPPPAELAYK